MIKSPCNNVCKVNSKSKYCEGCKRTLEEIASWSMASDEEKLKILEEIKKR